MGMATLSRLHVAERTHNWNKVEYFDRAEALEAVGLSEQDAHADS